LLGVKGCAEMSQLHILLLLLLLAAWVPPVAVLAHA
jgi:hypothetical protein